MYASTADLYQQLEEEKVIVGANVKLQWISHKLPCNLNFRQRKVVVGHLV